MELSVTSLPDIYDLTALSYTVSLVYDSTDTTVTESDAVIDTFVSSIDDPGVTLTIGTGSVSLNGTGYRNTFQSEIGYARPQVDLLTKPEYVEEISWGDIPEPSDDSDIWFLYKYKPPANTTITCSYTVSGTYTRTESTSGIPTENTPFSLTFTQVVNYDIEANVAEFRRYV